jgi:hypothetical protein
MKQAEKSVFSIGDVVIGKTASAKAEMTRVDLLIGEFLPTTRAELNSLKDASDGITVRDGIAAILECVSIAFCVYSSDFRKAAVLKAVMSEAVTQCLMSSNDIKSPANAFTDFYEAQEINYSFFTQATISQD